MAGQRITAAEVGLADTIGILRQPWIRPRRTSAAHGWSEVYLSIQSEQPYHASFEPARTHLVVLHLDGPVKLEYGSGGWVERKSVPAGGFVLHPAGTCSAHSPLSRIALVAVREGEYAGS